MSETLTADVLRAHPLPEAGTASDKEERGRVLIVGSCGRVPGAVLLSGQAALRAGAGKLQLAVPKSLSTAIGVAMPESGVISTGETEYGDPVCGEELEQAATGADSILLGPGLMDEDGAHIIAQRLLKTRKAASFVLDAAVLPRALALRGLIRGCRGQIVLTPHMGEMAALLGVSKEAVEQEPEKAASDVARKLNCIVALKSATTFISDPNGTLWRNEQGAVGLGTGGSGDVLAGIIAGLLAGGAKTLDATLWGVFVHAEIGRRLTSSIAPLGFLARDLLTEIPPTLRLVSTVSGKAGR